MGDYWDTLRELEDEQDSRLASDSEANREYARNAGAEDPTRAWILTPWDSWERNPSYHGPDVPHPEDDSGDYEGDDSMPFDYEGDEIPF